MIINFKNDNGYEIIINMDNVLYIQPLHSGGYRVTFTGGRNELDISWKEYERLTKAIESH